MSAKLNVNLIEIVAWKMYFVFFIHPHDLSRGLMRTSNNHDKIICFGAENFENLFEIKFGVYVTPKRTYFHIKYPNRVGKHFFILIC